VTTPIAAYNSDGCQGRRDAKWYAAHKPVGDCICGERNHGAGQQRAIDNTRELAESRLEQARANGQDIAHAERGRTWRSPRRWPGPAACAPARPARPPGSPSPSPTAPTGPPLRSSTNPKPDLCKEDTHDASAT
jgi:hypothetical protein